MSVQRRDSRKADKSSRPVTSKLCKFSRLVVNRELGARKGSEAGRIGIEELLEDLASFFNNDLSRKMRSMSRI